VTADATAVAAARLLGLDRPWRRATDNDLHVEAEYRLRAARECLALDPPSPELCAFHDGALEGIRVEIERRLAIHAPGRSKGMTAADVERIRDRAPCQEVAEYLGVAMKPRGPRRWEGHCPFHADATPSLSVWVTHWVCFGCGEKGDVFELVRRLLRMRRVSMAGTLLPNPTADATFRDAVRLLADFGGLPDPTVPPKRYSVEVDP
jgi:GNAT superfamily N-acetyltransferase